MSCILSQHIQSRLEHLNVCRAAPQLGDVERCSRHCLGQQHTRVTGRSRCCSVCVFSTGARPSACARSRWAIVLLLGRRGESRPPQPPQWPYGNRGGPLSARQWRHHGGRAGDHVQTGEHPGDTVGRPAMCTTVSAVSLTRTEKRYAN